MLKIRNSLPFKLSFAYALAGIIWITVFTSLRIPRLEQQKIAYFDYLHSWLFVLVSTVILYLIAKRRLTQADLAQEQLLQNMEELKQTYAKLAQDRARLLQYRLLSENTRDIFLFLDVNGKILEGNTAALQAYGYDYEELVGMNIEELLFPGANACLGKNEQPTAETRETIHRRKDGTPLPVEVSSHSTILNDQQLILCIARDLTERKQAEEAFSYQSHHDFLTGLPNRILFNDRLTQALAQARRRKRKRQKVAVLLLDMDRFKLINDSLGHTIGDKLLHAVSRRLKGSLREGDTIARQGGDEFIILLPEVSQEKDAVIVAQKILEVLAEPFTLDTHEVYITASIGISLYPGDGDNSESLIKHADTAMNHAKKLGRNNYQFFTASLNIAANERLTLENKLRKAIEREEFVLYYQPQICLNTGKVIGTEALLRWQQPDGNVLAPGQFIPIAEETGLIVPIGEWVLRTACTQGKAWQMQGLPPHRLAVNLSARQFHQPNLVAMVSDILGETGLDPCWLTLEITESIAMDDVKYTVEILKELKQMGIRLAIDDFGTGFSSLIYLKRFPIDTLKIDKAFVGDIGTEGGEIVTSIILLAQNLNLKVIAEGVETREQCAFLQQHRCDEMQGYLFSRPLPAAKFELMMREGKHFRVEEQLTLFS
ncbi:putative bifunctional diguanylate cyclase/phosphodiesterase [Paradesulfitobacterium ferrireducens]|uniref:putative bifunctional diguanylate cyclase/phosphodiesterase n=1 Tax=Paradesulfitobacterium ferrireducens TaxID=2816476 RepID=UPI002E28CE01|nr:EAL domain-containing protein [Paradesulfitobacterium ferrireducens]